MGDIEQGTCDICKQDKPLQRKYYYYDIKCECCRTEEGQHFEIVFHCNDCIPKPPLRVKVSLTPIRER